MRQMVTIHDLLSLDSPAVKRAMQIDCGMCHVPPGVRCKPLNPRLSMLSVVHFCRATQHYPEAKNEK